MVRKKKWSAVDLFAGAGGFGLGFHLAGFDIQLSLEIDKWAVDTLNENKFPNHKVIHDDIRIYDSEDKIKTLFRKFPTVIIGGPPCQGFSVAGPIKDPNDPRNTLFKDFAFWIKTLKPKIFVMENVKGILSRKNQEGRLVIEVIKETFEEIGYVVEIWSLNASDFGVPQNRERVFIVGNLLNKVIGSPDATHGNGPKLKPKVRVWEAISDMPNLKAGEGVETMKYVENAKTSFQQWARRGSKKIYNHVSMKHTKRLIERYRAIIRHDLKVELLPDEIRVRKRNGNGIFSEVKYQSNYRRLHPKRVSFTIPASFYSNFIHSYQPRNITSREAARIQSFPDWYIFKGKRTQISSNLLKKNGREDEDYLSQYNQIGNAVPPLLSRAIAIKLKKFLTRNIK